MDQPPQAQVVEEEKKDAEQSLHIQKDEAGSSKADWGKGLICPEDLNIPNDPNLQAAMKESKKDCEDFAQNIVFHTSIMMQEAQQTQIKLFQKLQLNFKNQL